LSTLLQNKAFSDKMTREELIGRNVEEVDVLIYDTKSEIS
jgi:hypothetical protein